MLDSGKRFVEVLSKEMGQDMVQVKLLGNDKLTGVKIFVSKSQIVIEDKPNRGTSSKLLRVA